MLEKLGFKSISDMTDEELRALVSNDRIKRVTTRVAGRMNRIAADGSHKPSHVRVHPVLTLESVGLAPALIVKLRASGKSDVEIITQMKERGLL
jgi:hypothetical protein